VLRIDLVGSLTLRIDAQIWVEVPPLMPSLPPGPDSSCFVPFGTGISQSYISQWLLQQGLEMSDTKRRAFYRWYLLERNNPGEMQDRSSLICTMCPDEGGHAHLEMTWSHRGACLRGEKNGMHVLVFCHL